MRDAIPQLATFGGVGLLAFVVDVGGYNLLRITVMPDQVIWAKVVSVTVATGVAWLGHRYLTFRRTRRPAVVKELLLFGLANGGGLLIASGCLFVSHYVLGFTSTLADNISGNVVGLVLGTLFRYFTYRFLVFRSPQEETS
ncbi:GtrA family protein [Microbacterium sp. EST19A]|uniref:GtrA family protein n=1 Tax=Microbacterium sp. EST19A TaxID=2862681 RepID=UPI001CBC38C7|nr:GtrA family protein [Microbacterium sp. EST19A]